MPFPIGEVIAAGATIASTGANAYAQGKTNRKTRAQNQYFFDRNREYALSDWNAQNEYNSPKNQMARMKAAGLNPALIYGTGANASNAGDVRGTAAPNNEVPAPQVDTGIIGQAMGNLYQAKTMKLQESILQQNLKNEQKREALVDAQTLRELASADSTSAGANRQKFDLAVETELRPYTLSTRRSGSHTAANIVDNTAIDTKLKTKELENKSTQQNLANEFMRASIQEKQALIRKIEEEIKNAGLQGKLMQYEDQLHQSGTQKTDPWYYRLLLQILGGDTP